MALALSSEQKKLVEAVSSSDEKAFTVALQNAVDNTVDLNAPIDNNGDTLLHIIIEQEVGSNMMLESLLAAGADPDAVNTLGKTALHTMVKIGNSVKLRPLIAAGADLNIQDRGQKTPLHICAGFARVDFADHLLQLGADSTLEDSSGKQAYELCQHEPDGDFPRRMRENLAPPPAPKKGEWSKEGVTKKADNGICALDAGATWLRSEQMFEELVQRGEHLTRDTLLKSGKNDMSYLERAAHNGVAETAFAHIHEQGEKLGVDDLLDADGAPNSLLQKLMDSKQVMALFQNEAWCGHKSQDLVEFYHKLPEDAQEQVTNFSRLKAQLRQEQQQGITR